MNTAIDAFIAESGSNPFNRLLWLVGEGWGKQEIIKLVAAIAQVGAARIISGADWVPGYPLAQEIRRRATDVQGVLERLTLARAFTCYQMVDLLAHVEPGTSAIVVLDLLSTFYDPDIRMGVRMRVLRQSIQLLQELSLTRPVAVLIRPTLEPDYHRFYAVITSVSENLLQAIPELQKFDQPGLFSKK